MSGNGAYMLLGDDLARMDEEQRAKWRAEQVGHRAGKGPNPDAAGFNAVQFYTDLMNAARQLGVKTQAALARDTRVDLNTIQRMRRGLAPSLATALLLAAWCSIPSWAAARPARWPPGSAASGSAAN